MLNLIQHPCATWVEWGTQIDRAPVVYFVASQTRGTIYVGVTSQPIKRWWEHRSGALDGFTKKYGVTRLVYVEFFGDMTLAIAREKQLKAWRRAWKVALIEEVNPAWRDLGLDYGLEPVAVSRTACMDAESSSA